MSAVQGRDLLGLLNVPRTKRIQDMRRYMTMPKRWSTTVIAVVLLSSLGLLTYSSISKRAPCSPTSRYIQSALLGQANSDSSSTKPDSQQQSRSSSSTTPGLQQGILEGLLHPEAISGFLSSGVKAGLASTDLRRLVQLQQQSYCIAGHGKQPPPGSVGVPIGNVTLYVYLKQFRMWETEVEEWLWALKQWKPPSAAAAAAAAAAGGVSVPDRPLAVDVGANRGWFTIKAAMAGARVAAFEAMPANAALLRHTLCANPWLSDRVALYNTGLGDQASECYLISGNISKGDSVMKCNKTEAYNTQGYEVHATIPLMKLEELLDEDVQVLKIDAEGFEQKVLTGGEGLFKKRKVYHIIAECNTGTIGEEGGKKLIHFLHAHGYEASPKSFQGPYWDAAQIPKASCHNIKLYARLLPT